MVKGLWHGSNMNKVITVEITAVVQGGDDIDMARGELEGDVPRHQDRIS